jgi:hypothetical protein
LSQFIDFIAELLRLSAQRTMPNSWSFTHGMWYRLINQQRLKGESIDVQDCIYSRTCKLQEMAEVVRGRID